MIQSPPALLNLSDLSGRIDIQGFYESHGCVVAGKPTNSNEGYEWPSSCPECGGTDRASFWESGRFCCVRGCRAKCSSPYWFLRDIEGRDHLDALEELGIDPDEVDSYSPQDGKNLPLFLTSDEAPNKKWQEAARAFCHAAEKCLWSAKGESARAYLHSRGFTDATIKVAHLGLCPDWYKAPLEDWGLSPEQLMKEDDPQIKIPRGIVIPWFVGDDLWKIQIRRPEPGPDGKKYKEVLGSSDCLYSIGPIEPDRPILLVESELDALSAYQEAGDLIQPIATGSTSKGQTPRALAILHQASIVLQGFDADEAGQRGTADWQRLIPSIVRHEPWSHDINDMLKEDMGIREWVELGLSSAEQGEVITYVDGTTETLEEFWASCTPPAVDRTGKEISSDLIARYPNIVERVLAFQDAALARKKICCDTLDWAIDWDGLLVCPCVIRLREENRLLNARLEQEERARKRKYGLIG